MKDSREHCIFCQIIAKKSPASVVYKDEHVIAFLDLYPLNPGHLLVLPLEHSSELQGVSPEVSAHMFKIARKLSLSIRKSEIKADAMSFVLSDGQEAGQDVFHTHLHVIPRFEDDGIRFGRASSSAQKMEYSELDLFGQYIKDHLDS